MGKDNKEKASAIVEVIDGGPLKITGQILLRDLKRDITEEGPAEVCLCRCGQSGNKPYCDRSHKR
jgi:CDGSH-type Zn-finger protein